MSRVGDTFYGVAIAWLVLDIGSPGDLGLLLLVGGLPRVFSAPVAGHLLDRFGPRGVLVIDNVARGLLVATIPILAATQMLELMYLYPLMFVTGLFASATEVGQEIIIPLLVEDADLESANALMSATFDLSEWCGPVLAGVAVQGIGVNWAMAVNAVSFFFMALAASVLPKRLTDESATAPVRPGSFLSGFRLLIRQRAVFSLTLLTCGVLAVDGGLAVYWPTYSRNVLESGPASFGLLVSAAGLGSLLGTLVITPLFTRFRSAIAVSLAVGLPGALLLPLAFVRSLAAAAILAFLFGLMAAPFYPISRAILQRAVPERERGRVFGARVAITTWAFPIGGAVSGLLLSRLPAMVVMLLLAALHLPMIILARATLSANSPTLGETLAKAEDSAQ